MAVGLRSLSLVAVRQGAATNHLMGLLAARAGLSCDPSSVTVFLEHPPSATSAISVIRYFSIADEMPRIGQMRRILAPAEASTRNRSRAVGTRPRNA